MTDTKIETVINEACKLLKTENIVFIKILEAHGSAPRGAGALMLVSESGKVFGTIGGGTVEYEACKFAKTVLDTKKSTIKEYNLSKAEIANLGMICGGRQFIHFHYIDKDGSNVTQIEYLKNSFGQNKNVWYIEKLCDEQEVASAIFDDCLKLNFGEIKAEDFESNLNNHVVLLKKENYSIFIMPIIKAGMVYIFGGGHVSQETVPVLSNLGFATTVIDDRTDFANKELFPTANKTMSFNFLEIDKNITLNACDYVIIMTRGHEADYQILKQVLKHKLCYYGCIGSRAKIATTKKRLLSDGIEQEKLDKLHSPIGLEIKAETPQEIAISIAAQLIEHRAIYG